MYVVRELHAGDAEAFREIRLEALQLHPDAYGSAFEDEAHEPLDNFRNQAARGGVFGGFANEHLLGMAMFFVHGAARLRHKGGLGGMYIRERARGTGLADKIVAAIVEHAQSRVELINLSVAVTNKRAIRFYERVGFSTYATEPRALKIGTQYLDEYLMVRFLGP